MSLIDKMPHPTGYRIAVCENCKNFLGYEGGAKCRAYPHGMPDDLDIFDEKIKHRDCSENFRYNPI